MAASPRLGWTGAGELFYDLCDLAEKVWLDCLFQTDYSGIPLALQIYTICQLEQAKHLYNEPLLIDLRGDINVHRLEEALMAVSTQQEGLRCSFVQGPDSLSVAVRDRLDSVPLKVLDLQAKVPPDAPTEHPLVHTCLMANAQQVFDLTGGGALWRTLVVRIAEDRSIVLITLHHTIMDAW